MDRRDAPASTSSSSSAPAAPLDGDKKRGPQWNAGHPDQLSADDGQMMPLSYTLRPPPWRPRLHPGSTAIGVPDLFRPGEGRPEDDMSETTVRNGLSLKPVVANETFSAHDMIYDRLKATGLVTNLATLFDEVVTRRFELNMARKGLVSDHQFKQPPRVTLNDVKLNAYIKELADPDVPLKKLARSVPHGYRGERMLEMLWTGAATGAALKGTSAVAAAAAAAAAAASSSSSAEASDAGRKCVDIDRAVWFIRVVGASEIASSKARQTNVANYTAEWTSVVTGWLKRQISELTAAVTTSSPSSPATAAKLAAAVTPNASRGSGAKEPTGSLLLDTETSKRWVSKWTYSLNLIRALAMQRILDRRALIRWAIDQLRAAHPWQAPFVLVLVQENFEYASSDVQLLHLLIDTVCHKLAEYSKSQVTPSPTMVILELKRLLVVAFDANPEAFINPARWVRHASTILATIREAKGSEEQRLPLVEERNMKLIAPKAAGMKTRCKELEEYEDIHLLDSFQADDDALQLFTDLSLLQSSAIRTLREKVATLLTWATTTRRCGVHRPILAARLLQLLEERLAKGKSRGRRTTTDKLDLDTMLIDWVSSVDAAMEGPPSILKSIDLASLVTLVGELIRRRCFSFPRYIQRLTARGLTASTSSSKAVKNNARESLLVKLLRSVAVDDCPAPLQHQRRTAIYGNRTKESYEEAMERRATRELLAELSWLQQPQLNGVDGKHEAEGDGDLNTAPGVPHFWASSRYVKNRLVARLVMDPIRAHGPEALFTTSRRLEQLSQLLGDAEEFADLYEVLDRCLQSENTSLIAPVCAVMLRHSLLWASLGDPSPLLQRIAALVTEGAMSGLQMIVAVRTLSVFGLLRPMGTHQAEDPTKPDAAALERLRTAIRSVQASQEPVAPDVVAAEISSGTLNAELVLRELCVRREASDEGSFTTGQGDASLIAWLVDVVASSLQSATLKEWDDAAKSVFQDDRESPSRFVQFAVELVGRGILSPRTLLIDVLAPVASDCAQGKLDDDAKEALLRSTSLLLDAQSSALSPLQGASLPVLLRRDCRAAFCTLLINLCIVGSGSSSPAETALCDAICRKPEVRAALYPHLLDIVGTIKSICVATWRAGVNVDTEATLSHILSLLVDDEWNAGLAAPQISHPVELDPAYILDRLQPFSFSQTLAELAGVVLERLERAEGGLQARAQSKLQALAKCTFDRLFSGRAGLELGIHLLRESSARSFAGMVLEEALSRILARSSDPEPTMEDKNADADSLYALLTLSHEQHTVTTASGTANSAALLRILTEQLEAAATDAETNATATSSTRMLVRLVNLLLLIDNLWSSASRPQAPRLFASLVKLCVSVDLHSLDVNLSQDVDGEDANEDIIAPLLDTATNLLVQVPTDVAASCLHLAKASLPRQEGEDDETLLSFVDPPLSNEVLRRLTWLFGSSSTASMLSAPLSNVTTSGQGGGGTRASSNSVSGGSLQTSTAGNTTMIDVQASSASAAFVNGHFLTVEERPWDWHDNVEFAQAFSGTNQGTTAATSKQSSAEGDEGDGGEAGMESVPLLNSASISLARFGAVKTRDRVPTHCVEEGGRGSNGLAPPPQLDSELDYGERFGGEPLYARDARRGIVEQGVMGLAFGGGVDPTVFEDKEEETDIVKDEDASKAGPKRKRSSTGVSELPSTSKAARVGTAQQ